MFNACSHMNHIFPELINLDNGTTKEPTLFFPLILSNRLKSKIVFSSTEELVRGKLVYLVLVVIIEFVSTCTLLLLFLLLMTVSVFYPIF